MTQGPQVLGELGAELPATAARRTWQPSSMLAAQSMAASARGFNTGMMHELPTLHGRLSRRSESIGIVAAQHRAMAERPIAIHGAPMLERFSALDQAPPLIRTFALPTLDAEAVSQSEPMITKLQMLAALPKQGRALPRRLLRGDRHDPATAERFVVLPSPSVAQPSEPPASPARPSLPSRAPPPVLRRRPEAAALAFRPSEPASVSRGLVRADDRAPATAESFASVSAVSSGEQARTTVAVIQPRAVTVRGAVRPVTAERSAMEMAARAPDRVEPSVGRSHTAPSVRAITQLIEQTIRPAPLPGLEVRLLNAAPRAGNDQHAIRDSKESSASVPPRRQAAPPSPPLNIDAIADKVYHVLQRRQRFERERKGRF
jgi:hypothetical protein